MSRPRRRTSGRRAGAASVVVTCEHACRAVPVRWRRALAPARGLLDGHRGWDPGALPLARALAAAFSAPLHAGRATRLLVDLNRSPGHPRLFSRWTAGLPARERTALLAQLYRPFRAAVARDVGARVRAGRAVVHLSCHSFTPVLDGVRRATDVGVLYDPSRPREALLAARWRDALAARRGDLAVHRNRPYRGTSDGHTTALRRRFADRAYAGLEIELNQRLLADRAAFRRLLADLVACWTEVLAAPPARRRTRRAPAGSARATDRRDARGRAAGRGREAVTRR